MKKRLNLLLLCLCFTLFSCTELIPAFEETYIETVSEKDDFYTASNKDWMLNHLDLSLTKYSYSADQELAANVEKQVPEMLAKVANKTNKTKNEEILLDFYNSAMDFETRNKEGVEPVRKYINLINNSSTIEEFIEADLKIISDLGFSTIYTLDTNYLFGFLTRSFSNTFATGNNVTRIKQGYEKLLKVSGFDEEKAKEIAALSCDLKQKVAQAMTTLPGYEPNANVTSVNLSNLEKQLPFLNFNKIFAAYDFPKQSILYVNDLGLFETTISLFTTENLEQLKADALMNLLYGTARKLTEEHLKIFYEIVAVIQKTGTLYINEQVKNELAISSTVTYVAPVVEELYINEYSPQKTKDSITTLANTILDEYKKLVANTPLFNDRLKNIATKKLEKMRLDIAYPENLPDYVEKSNYFKKTSYVEKARGLYKAQNSWTAHNNNKTEPEKVWKQNLFTINAFYYPQDNSFTICSGVLQEPYYNENLSEEELLGSIGMIVAHEIAHAFDSNFINYNHLGNFSYAWNEETLAKYNEWTAQIVENYTFMDFYERQNSGEKTLAENISDILAMQCCLEILKNKENANYKAFFESFAKINRFTAVEGYFTYRASEDIHSLPRTRVNRTVANFQEFYDTYGITKKDGMYIKPEDRVRF